MLICADLVIWKSSGRRAARRAIYPSRSQTPDRTLDIGTLELDSHQPKSLLSKLTNSSTIQLNTMDSSDLLAAMGIGGFGKQKKKPTAGLPPQQQARHDAARRPLAATFAPASAVGRPISKFWIFSPTSFAVVQFCTACTCRISSRTN